jgi:SSS family solute:Na+ symporter
MTLYQRIYASKGPKQEKLLGCFEYWQSGGYSWNVSQRRKGMFAGYRCASMDSEMGLPVLLATVSIGLMGLMLSSYFSAILSTADGCLMAASEIVTDIIQIF